MSASPCPTCHGPRRGEEGRGGHVRLISPHRPAALEDAMRALIEAPSGYLETPRLLDRGRLEALLAPGDAIAVREAFSDLLVNVVLCAADAYDSLCPGCRGPVTRFRGLGRGWRWRPVADVRFSASLYRLRTLVVDERPEAFHPVNPYYRPGDEREPLMSERFLRALLGRHPSGEVRAALAGLEAAMGRPARAGAPAAARGSR